MSELTFTHGTMSAGKTTLALQLNWQLSSAGTRTAMWTFGDRSGTGQVTSRIGLAADATAVTPGAPIDDLLRGLLADGVRVLIVDEAQFASADQIDALAALVDEHGIDVHAFGLTADFRQELFPGSARLLAVADRSDLLPLAAYCWCGEKARVNARVQDGVVVTDGDQAVIGDTTGGTVSYRVLCRRHYRARQLSAW